MPVRAMDPVLRPASRPPSLPSRPVVRAAPAHPQETRMSRTHRPLDGAAAEARATLPEADAARFDRLAGTVLGSPGAGLGPALRAALPGTSGVRWLHGEGLAPSARASALTSAQWLSLFATWSET